MNSSKYIPRALIINLLTAGSFMIFFSYLLLGNLLFFRVNPFLLFVLIFIALYTIVSTKISIKRVGRAKNYDVDYIIAKKFLFLYSIKVKGRDKKTHIIGKNRDWIFARDILDELSMYEVRKSSNLAQYAASIFSLVLLIGAYTSLVSLDTSLSIVKVKEAHNIQDGKVVTTNLFQIVLPENYTDFSFNTIEKKEEMEFILQAQEKTIYISARTYKPSFDINEFMSTIIDNSSIDDINPAIIPIVTNDDIGLLPRVFKGIILGESHPKLYEYEGYSVLLRTYDDYTFINIIDDNYSEEVELTFDGKDEELSDFIIKNTRLIIN